VAFRPDKGEHTRFNTIGTEVANVLLNQIIAVNTPWAEIEKALKRKFNIVNWAVEARQPLQWLVNNGFVKEVKPEVYTKS
jgi:hypothetical protein